MITQHLSEHYSRNSHPWDEENLPVAAASCTKAQPSSLATDRNMLVKVTFHTIHELVPDNMAMYLTGSLLSLGSWDLERARKMKRDGSWTLAIYVPKNEQFFYKYLLLQVPEVVDASQEPIVLWQGSLERKCKLVERCLLFFPRML